MKSTGIIRKVDELGRIVVPVELRKKLNINIKDEVEIYVERSSIVIKKYDPSCVFCGKTSDLEEFEDKLICKKCLEKIKKLNVKNK